MPSFVMKNVRGPRARRAPTVAILAGVACAVMAACTSGSASAQTSAKIPEFSSSTFHWVRVRADGRNALYGDGWLDPPTGMRGPVKAHPDHPSRAMWTAARAGK